MCMISIQNKVMKIKITLVAFLLISLASLAGHAEFTRAKCSYVLTGSGEIQINRQWDTEAGLCMLEIHPRNVVDLKYRDFYFDNLGHFMVFNSYGDGPDNLMTAAREYFVFPIVEDYPDFSIEENGDVIVKMVSGHLFKISAANFSVLSLTPGTFTEKPLSPNNAGGLEFKLTTGFWIDGGFKKGGSRLSSPSLSSFVKSGNSAASCSIVNRTFLNYEADGNYTFKFQKENLLSFLKTKCPTLPL